MDEKTTQKRQHTEKRGKKHTTPSNGEINPQNRKANNKTTLTRALTRNERYCQPPPSPQGWPSGSFVQQCCSCRGATRSHAVIFSPREGGGGWSAHRLLWWGRILSSCLSLFLFFLTAHYDTNRFVLSHLTLPLFVVSLHPSFHTSIQWKTKHHHITLYHIISHNIT